MKYVHGAVYIFLILSFLSGCLPNTPVIQNTTQPSPAPTHTSTHSPSPSPPALSTPSKTPRTPIDLTNFSIQIDNRTCALKEVDFYDLYVFQADCADAIYMAQAQEVTITLLPPDGQVFPISPIAEQEAIFGALEPPFVYGEYIPSDKTNTATYAIPMFKYSGEPILCGFSIPHDGKDVLIVVTGLTTRSF